ncbi:Hypothetical_protein [Hexamita inflata]|uniref:Hypothetical_protein n=1 Tax=Hexamita inflata TaxID=28002 RepID=A0AA86QKH6_9EUKA|nr:Hypothetical protein HINF_LOCUS43042 [Hexamita inflata]
MQTCISDLKNLCKTMQTNTDSNMLQYQIQLQSILDSCESNFEIASAKISQFLGNSQNLFQAATKSEYLTLYSSVCKCLKQIQNHVQSNNQIQLRKTLNSKTFSIADLNLKSQHFIKNEQINVLQNEQETVSNQMVFDKQFIQSKTIKQETNTQMQQNTFQTKQQQIDKNDESFKLQINILTNQIELIMKEQNNQQDNYIMLQENQQQLQSTMQEQQNTIQKLQQEVQQNKKQTAKSIEQIQKLILTHQQCNQLDQQLIMDIKQQLDELQLKINKE